MYVQYVCIRGESIYINISICTGIRLSGDIRYIVLMIHQCNVWFKNSTFERRARISKFKNGLWQKKNKFCEYSAKKEYNAAKCNSCSNELHHTVGKQKRLSITNDIINLSPSQPNAPAYSWWNLLITSVPWLFSDVIVLFHFIQYIGYRN